MNAKSPLSLLPDELPFTFTELPAEERAWRGRLFLMVWILYGHKAYSWWVALASDRDWESNMRQVVSEASDDFLAEAFAVAWEERRRW